MLYETTTRLAPQDALSAAEHYFHDEYGLDVGRRGSQALNFEGGGGYVLVSIIKEHPTTLELETREWDATVTHFIEALPR